MKIWAICRYASLILRKDKLFLPFLLTVPGIFLFGLMASEWTIEDMEKVLMDLTALGLHLFGSLVTILWGTQLFNTFPEENSSLEFELVAPISRINWILGRFLGLALHLSITGFVFFVLWTGIFAVQGYAIISPGIAWMFGLQILGWLTLASLTAFIGTLCKRNLAIVSCSLLWICGLIAPVTAITAEGQGAAAEFARNVSKLWNFQRFNVVPGQITDLSQCLFTMLYAGGLIAVLLSLSCLIFQKRQVFR